MWDEQFEAYYICYINLVDGSSPYFIEDPSNEMWIAKRNTWNKPKSERANEKSRAKSRVTSSLFSTYAAATHWYNPEIRL